MVVGDSDFAANANIDLYGNRDLLLNMLSWLAREQTLIALRARAEISQPRVLSVRERHLIALKSAGKHLNIAAEHAAQDDQSLDLFAEELRLAQVQLSSITGEFSPDDLLGVIFSRFCIGK